MDLLSNPNYCKKDDPWAPLREEVKGQRSVHRQFAQQEVEKLLLLGYPRPIHTRRKVPKERDWQRSNRKKNCRQMDDLADEDHTHHFPKKLKITKVIGGFVRTPQVPKLCQFSAYLTSNEHSQPCCNWNKKKKEFYKRPRTLAEINNGQKLFFVMELVKFMEDSFFLWKSRSRWTKQWKNGVACWTTFGSIFLGKTFLNSIALLQMDRSQLTAVYFNQRRA